jgi:hypothetical protein
MSAVDAGVTAVNCEELTKTTLVAAVPLGVLGVRNRTVAPDWKPEPLMVTVVPPVSGPDVGLMLVMAKPAT